MWKKIAIFAAMMVVSNQSYAFVDMDYYTHGSFQETVDAFKRAALFFSLTASPFQSLIFAFFGAGLISAVLVSAYSSTSNALSGQAGSKMPVFLYITIIGAGIVSVTIAPKNTIHVYDQTFNRYESVGNVPSILVLAAGVTNLVTETYKEQLSISTAYPFGELTNGSPFQLIKTATNSPSKFYSNYLMQSLGNYYVDCAPTANALGNVNIDTMKSGTTSLMSELAKMKHNTIYTTYYSSSVPSGEYISCGSAYDKIAILMNNPTTFKRHFDEMCSQLRLDPNNAVDASTCRGMIESTFQTAYNVAGTNYTTALQNVLAASAIERAIETGNVEDAVKIQANRTQVAEAVGVWTIANEYIPTIKGVMFVLILACTPFLLLACLTPLMPTALKTYFSLFAFYMLWEILDTSVVYMFEDQLMAVMHDLQTSKMGLISMWSSPTDSMKALALLGQQRSAAITLATFIAVALFRVSAHALAGIASKTEGNIENTGEQLGKDFNIQENAGHRMTDMAAGNASLQTLRNTGGHDGYVSGVSANTTANVRSGQLLAQSDSVELAAQGSAFHQMESGETAQRLGDEFGGMSGAAMAMGQANATKQAASSIATNTTPNAKEKLIASEQHSLGQGKGYMEARAKTGASIEEMGAYASSTSATQAMSEKGTLQQNGINPLDAYEIQGDLEAGQKAGDKRYVDKNPDQAFDTAQQTAYNQHIQQGENVGAIRNLTPNPETYFKGAETKNVADDVAHYELREQLSNTFNANDVDVARMLSGNQRLNLTADQVESGYQAGLIKEDAYNLGMANNGLALESDMVVDNGALRTNKTAALSGDAVHSDNSTNFDSSFVQNSGYTVTDEVRINQGENTENAYKSMQDENSLRLIGRSASQGAPTLGHQQQAITQAMVKVASDGIGGAIQQTKENSSIDNKSISGTAEWGLPDWLSGITGADGAITARYDKSNQDSLDNTMDTLRSNYLNPANNMIWERVEHEVAQGVIDEKQMPEKFYEYAADHHQYIAEVMDGVKPNPLEQVGAQPWQNDTMALFYNWEKEQFGDVSYTKPIDNDDNSNNNVKSETKDSVTPYQTYTSPQASSTYGMAMGGYGSGGYIEEAQKQREESNAKSFEHKARLRNEVNAANFNKPPIPQGNFGWGTREFPPKK
ncbi:conjugal transfer protein TraG N-terminal domain-containing protein [Vibrio aestuarianus]|uniref:conjugal transfer protein TraG N-terminal domain-containing protein n=2 Tax=Bacteria TaxID=2 RepID=UPI00237D0011|nr:conjugal transfer protein TraG N-terminal domain-containing protein [Vibrio aestuarianus]MDE1315488.1 conjugal transfer protein TraG N-terminal domain-containing protein [Vibrio aestuarianus]